MNTVHWRFYNTSLLPEYFILLENLERISELCRGATESTEEETLHPSNLDLAGKYVLHLQCLHQKCSSLPSFRLDPNYGGLLPPLAVPPPLAATSSSSHPRLTDPSYLKQPKHPGQSPGNSFGYTYGTNGMPLTTQSPTSAISPRSQAHIRRPTGLSPTWYTNFNNNEQRNVSVSEGLQSMHHEGDAPNNCEAAELLAVSNQLMDQEFLDMDRVITLDDMDFALGFDLWNYGSSLQVNE